MMMALLFVLASTSLSSPVTSSGKRQCHAGEMACSGANKIPLSTSFRAVSEPWQTTSSLDGREFPLILSPPHEPSILDGPDGLAAWTAANRELLLQASLSHGAILLRDFPFRSAVDFAVLAQGLGLEQASREGSAAPRTNVVGTNGTVFTSNESPPSEPIPFHHEMVRVAPSRRLKRSWGGLGFVRVFASSSLCIRGRLGVGSKDARGG